MCVKVNHITIYSSVEIWTCSPDLYFSSQDKKNNLQETTEIARCLQPPAEKSSFHPRFHVLQDTKQRRSWKVVLEDGAKGFSVILVTSQRGNNCVFWAHTIQEKVPVRRAAEALFSFPVRTEIWITAVINVAVLTESFDCVPARDQDHLQSAATAEEYYI